MKKVLTGLIFSFFSLLVSLLLLEGLLRLFWHPPFLDQRYQRDDFNWLKENVVLNSMGWRDREFDPDDLEGNIRILVLGDSYSFGWYINDPTKTFSRLLEENLNKKYSERTFEVINASRHGFSLAEELRRLEEEGIWFHPDLILVGVNIGEFADLARRPITPKPAFLAKSFVYQATIGQLLKTRQRKEALEHYEQVFADQSEGFKQTAEKLLMMKKIAQEKNADFTILIFPELDPYQPNGEYLFEQYHQKLKEFGEENQVLVIDPLDLFLAVKDKRGLVLNPVDSHPSAEAHQLVAEAILKDFDFSQLLVKQRILPIIKTARVTEIGQKIDDLRHVRKITSQLEYPVVYFNRVNGLETQSNPFLIAQNQDGRKLAFLEDKLLTVKSFTHSGWPGAVVEHNVEPPGEGQILVPAEVFGFPILGLKQLQIFYQDHGVVKSKSLIPKRMEKLENGQLWIETNLPPETFLCRLSLLVAVYQIDIGPDGTIVDITKSAVVSTSLDQAVSEVTLPLSSPAGSLTELTANQRSFNYTLVNGLMTEVEVIKQEGLILLRFKKKIPEKSQITFPVILRVENLGQDFLTLEYE